MCAVTICQHPDERVGIIELLPDRDYFCAVLLEERNFALPEALMEIVDTSLAVLRRFC